MGRDVGETARFACAMNTTSFLLRHAVFSTRELAVVCAMPVTSASRLLNRLEREGTVTKVTRGVWAQPNMPAFSPLSATSYLLNNEQGYVSFLTALHLHGVISQIPRSIQIATTGHTRKLKSRIGDFDLLRVTPRMMRGGIDSSETRPPYPIATAEKALLDTLYISTRKGRRFSSLPELELSELDVKELERLLELQITHLPAMVAIQRKLEQMTGGGVGAG